MLWSGFVGFTHPHSLISGQYFVLCQHKVREFINYSTLINNKYISIMFHSELQILYLLTFQLLLHGSDQSSGPWILVYSFMQLPSVPVAETGNCTSYITTFFLSSFLSIWWRELSVLRWSFYLSISVICCFSTTCL